MKKIILVLLTGAGLLSCTSQEIANNNSERSVANTPERKYFIVQNIATEKTRVYLKCEEDENRNCKPGTKNLMVFETEMVVGGRIDEKRTNVGVQNIEYWEKFKETEGVYPSFYDPTYPPVPQAGEGFKKWFKNDVMPDGNGEMRGAFGWYTTHLEPSDSGQWMHGTVGWGADGAKFIDFAHGKGFSASIANAFADQRSHGCTRHENRAIAYLQNLVPEGSALIKIYAKEDLNDSSLTRYSEQQSPIHWNYILTKEDVRAHSPRSSDADKVRARGVSDDMILEQGSYDADQYPTVQSITGKGAKSGESGDSYKLFKNDGPYGIFYIDSGTVTSDYHHPEGVAYEGVSTFKESLVPNYMKSINP